jgi:hypothetical protein
MNDAEIKNADIKIKQQVIDQIKAVNNILVTVSRDPSVDDLTALIGLTAVLNKTGKHATAIFSGAIPAAINFLEPTKVIENTADSLRDFIIALDKEKADHLRYKIEGDMVKIFITPYRTTISSDDLEFSQGDLNAELVLALGVENKEHLDSVLSTQGELIHDVKIVTLSDGTRKSELGSIDWNDKNASCLSEMVCSVGEALKSETPILDKQIATALLTGIVAATNRFSNIRTTSRVMTVAAQLMAAGADQQLIAAKLDEAHEIQSLDSANGAVDPNTLNAPVENNVEQASTLPPAQKDSLVIDHADEEPTVAPEVPEVLPETEETTSTLPPEEPLPQPEFIETPIQPVQPTISETKPELPQPQVEINTGESSTLSPEDMLQQAIDTMPKISKFEPSLGGTLNATTEQAAEDARRELEDNQNKTILTHSYLDEDQANNTAPINSTSEAAAEEKPVDIFNETNNVQPAEPSSLGEVPAGVPASLEGMPMPPPLPDFSTLPPAPMPDFGVPVPPLTMPPVQNTMPAQPISAIPSQQYAEVDNDPSKFRIPGQY